MQVKTQKDHIKTGRISRIHDYLMELYEKTYNTYVRIDTKSIAVSHGIHDSYVNKAIYSLGYMKKGSYHCIRWNTSDIPDMKMAEQVEIESKKFVNNLKLSKVASTRIGSKKNLIPIYRMDETERKRQMRLNMLNETYILQCLHEMYDNRNARFKLSERAHRYNIDEGSFFDPLITLDYVTKHLIVTNQYIWTGEKLGQTLAAIIKEAYQQTQAFDSPVTDVTNENDETEPKTSNMEISKSTTKKYKQLRGPKQMFTYEELENKVRCLLDIIFMSGTNQYKGSIASVLKELSLSSKYTYVAITAGHITYKNGYYSLTEHPSYLVSKIMCLMHKKYAKSPRANSTHTTKVTLASVTNVSNRNTFAVLEDKVLYFLDTIYMNGVNKCDALMSYILRDALNISSEYLTRAIRHGYISRTNSYYSLSAAPEVILIQIICLVNAPYGRYIYDNKITTFVRSRPPFTPLKPVRKSKVKVSSYVPVENTTVNEPMVTQPVSQPVSNQVSEAQGKLQNAKQKALEHKAALLKEQANLTKELKEIDALLDALHVIENSKYGK